MTVRSTLITIMLLIGIGSAAGESFYERPAIFSTRPNETKSLQSIKRFGPVGIGIDLIPPAFVMRISHIEEGSPAAATGKLSKGQIIKSINGQALANIDPRIQLGQILAKAEATDGKIRIVVKDQAEPIMVSIPILGSYSDTWPLNCPKSDKIVRQVADYLATPKSNKGIADIGMLFLLSTGEEQDLKIAHEWARKVTAPRYPWYLGYGGIPLCECYLRTGDQEILNNIQQWVDNAVKTQYLDGWIGRGGVSASYGNGHLNAAGTSVVTFLLLAKECGAEVPDHALMGALVHFYRYAGRGSNPYGDHRTEVGFVDNGKNGKLAFAMAAAAALTPDGEDSVYAAARDVCAMPSFYTTAFMLHGHTGGGIGEIWRSAAMGLLHERKPEQYREFMDNRQWHYDLSRRFDGSFGILGGSGYDKELWGIAYPLTYTIPRRTLRITGAPRTKFSRPYQLPKQPWGTQADNLFLSLKAVPDADGHAQDLSGETLAHDSSMPFLKRFHQSGEVSDELIRQYIHHQDHNIRFVAANKALGINSEYIGWRKPGGKVREELVIEFLTSQDPRVRRAMFMALHEILSREKRTELLTREVFDLAIQLLQDPSASWSVKDPALQVVGQAPTEWVVPHVDHLTPFLQQEDWWLQNAALTALTPVVADERCYRKVLPAIGNLLRSNQRTALTTGLLPAIRAKIRAAGPAVHQLATETLKETYTGYTGVRTALGGQDVSSTYDSHLEFIAASLADVPGGLDVLYEIARERFPHEILPYKQFFLSADPDQFGPKLRQAIVPIIQEELIPEFVGKNRELLRKLATVQSQSGYPGSHRDQISQLVALHKRAGLDEFDWHIFADLRQAEWSYHSFEPIAAEQIPFDQLITRYRPVTLPRGMENWYTPAFDPAAANWKTGRSPFANFQGKLPQHPIHKCSSTCTGPNCYGGLRANTLWEKEVLLLRASPTIPPLKDAHRYRIRIHDGNHVGSGGGHIIYINGRPLAETKTCNGRGSGGQPKGAFITREFLDDFQGGQVTIAVKTFLRFNDKYKVKPSDRIPQGKFSLHIEEMKLPPMSDDLVIKSATIVPMRCSEWQAVQDPDNRELQPDDYLFRWDGKFHANARMLGSWRLVTEVPEIINFDSSKPTKPRRPLFSEMTLKDGGETNQPTWIWSGDRLMDLTRFQALRMHLKTVGNTDYLFVEAGGFSERQKLNWKSPWLVLKKSLD